MSKSALIVDNLAFERQHGSLRKKHTLYKTGTIKVKQVPLHIDVKSITILDDHTPLFDHRKYLV